MPFTATLERPRAAGTTDWSDLRQAAQQPTGDGPTQPILEARDVTKVYELGKTTVEALRGVSMSVTAGEFVALMGPSGSGKSTLLHVLGGLEAPTAGEVTVAGRRVDGADDRDLTRLRRGHLGFIFQFFNLCRRCPPRRTSTCPR
jgi:putative ABC transport system ATP-binding protein